MARGLIHPQQQVRLLYADGLWTLTSRLVPCAHWRKDVEGSQLFCKFGFKVAEGKTPWPESASELYRPSDHRLSTKLVPTFAKRRCHMVSVTDAYGRILGFLDRNRYFCFRVVPQLYSRGWVNAVPDPLLTKSGSVGNRNRTFGSQARNFDY
jgi:hypothetical protein